MPRPRCPYCNAQGLKNITAHNTGPYAVVCCAQCGAIHGVVPVIPTPKKKPEKKQKTVAAEPAPSKKQQTVKKDNKDLLIYKVPNLLDHVGYADLSQKIPYNPQKMAARMKAAGLNQGTQYMHIASEMGPPICPEHKDDMLNVTIPAEYPNAGATVWVCPQVGCEEWELADE